MEVEVDRAEILRVAMDAELAGQPAKALALRQQLGALEPIEELLGKTLASVARNGNDSIDFVATTGERWMMYYEPDCCAKCSIEDVVGDLEDLVGAPIAMAEESTNSADPPPPGDYYDDSHTWTFYRFATAKGYVTIRWFGSSNGYYSERATFRRVTAAL
jgi:hypothetical protein